MKKLVLLTALVLLVSLSLPVSAGKWRKAVLGDASGDERANTTDVLIILFADLGFPQAAPYCPMNCGDVNLDGRVNSTDALIILIYDVGFPVPYPVGALGCLRDVQPPPSCAR